MDAIRQLKKSLEGLATKRKPRPDASGSTVKQKKKQRVVGGDKHVIVDDGITIRFPLSAHAHFEYVPHVEESKKLLWPEDKVTFKKRGVIATGRTTAANVFKGLQGVFHMVEEIEVYQAERGKLRSENAVFHSEVKSVKFELTEAKALITEQTEQLRLKELDATLLRSSVEALRADLFVAQTQNKIVAIQAEVKLRAELLRQFKDGKTDTSDFKKAFTEEKELEDMIALEGISRRPSPKRKSWRI